jgi:hypothetical protein
VTDATPKDETASRIINDYRGEADLDTVVAESEVALNATFAANYHRETNYGNLVTDAMRARADADVAITNAGGIRSDSVYGPGNVTGGDVFNTLPFPNTLVTVELTGAELKRTLESQVITLDSETGQEYGAEISQQTSGVRFEWNETSGEVTDVYVDRAGPTEEARWVPLEEEETYAVAVNSYMADGGSGYPLENATRLNETDELLATSVIEYLKPMGTVSPEVEGRMERVSTNVPVADATLELDGEGKVVVRMDAPSDLESVREGSVVAVPPAPGVDGVEAEQVVHDREAGELVVRFDDAALASIVGNASEGEIDVFADYTTSESGDRPFFKYSTLNADLAATVADDGAGAGEGTPGGDEGEVDDGDDAETVAVGLDDLAAPTAVSVGQTYAACITLENPSDEAVTRTVVYRVGGEYVEGREVTLDPGESRRVTTWVTAPDVEPGTYDHGLFVEGEGRTAAVDVAPNATANVSGSGSESASA